tara:strand:+ start:539 stop:1018 length:480 start_codon:yes stop_codon:yes gene_type:complete
MSKKNKVGVGTSTQRYIKQLEDAKAALKVCSNVFVYGSLKHGEGNSGILSTCDLVAETQTLSQWVLGDIGFPYAFPSTITPPEHKDLLFPVKGEVYAVTGEDKYRVFTNLDGLEGYPSHYNRTVIRTVSGHYAWMYIQEDWDCTEYCAPCKLEEGVWVW